MNFPASIFDKSKISFIKDINTFPLDLIVFTYFNSFEGKDDFNNISVKPTIAFIGVLIS